MTPLRLTLPCILAAVTLVQAASVKGVGPEKNALYTPSSDGQWQCLDGSKTIAFSAVNDDYCDCPDGSDEPGTSACPTGVFYCENKGHIPAYIKSYAVNDGVCDDACCDGSDETSGLIKCPNRCKEAAAEHAKAQAIINKIQAAGAAAKQKLVDQGQKTVNKWQNEKSKLEEELSIKRSFLMRQKSEIEALEKDVKKGQKKSGKSCPPCEASAAAVEKIGTLKADVQALQEEIDTLLSILQTMKRDHNHNFHDMAVKAAISGYDEFMSSWEEFKTEIDKDLDFSEDEFAASEDSEQWQEEEVDTETEEEQVVEDPQTKANKDGLLVIVQTRLEKYIPPVWRPYLYKLLGSSSSDTPTTGSALEAARKAYNDLEDEIRKAENKLSSINDDLSKDYGMDKEWLPLKDVCVDKNEGEYTYSLCIFGQAHQKSNKDGVRVNLGRFEKFSGDQPGGYYLQQAYTHGTKCWNGPERSVHVSFECGADNEILEVTEPEKCEYKYRMRTPAVCPLAKEKHDAVEADHVHEEL